MEILIVLIITAGVCLYIGHETAKSKKNKAEFQDYISNRYSCDLLMKQLQEEWDKYDQMRLNQPNEYYYNNFYNIDNESN